MEVKQNEVCEFTLLARVCAFAFPRHYCRQIKSVSISFPSGTGPYQNVNATLTQMSHYTLLEPSESGIEFLLNPQDGEMNSEMQIRGDWRGNQQIALSRSVNDSGLFQLNFQDEKYLPYEGTGCTYTWRL